MTPTLSMRRPRTRRRPSVDLAARTGTLSTALERGGARLDPEAVESARRVLARTDERMSLGVEYTVVALAGSTGSGKSSLFNALAGMDIATVGARRPTTSDPSAVVWGGDATALLDWLGVPRRHRTARESVLDSGEQDALHGLVLLDLPDHDSTVASHRLEVDRLVQLVDLLIWVVDPQKYADDVLHTQYLQEMREHRDVMLVALNQIDRLPAGQVADCVDDLRGLLAADGLAEVPVLTTSAATGEGLGDLQIAVAEAVRHHEVIVQRIVADLDTVELQLRPGVAESEHDPDQLPGQGVLVDALAGAAGVPAVLDAVEADYRRQAHAHTGWPLTRWLGRLRPDPMRRLRISVRRSDTGEPISLTRSSLPAPTQAQRAQVELASRQVASRSAEGLPQRWTDAVTDAAAPRRADVADSLDQAVLGVDLEYRTPTWWRMLRALQVILGIAVAAGIVWLAVLVVLAYLQLPEPELPSVGVLPLPTLMLVGGLVLGFLIAVLARWWARVGARRRRSRIERELRAAVAEVATQRVLEPVGQVLSDHRATRLALGVGR